MPNAHSAIPQSDAINIAAGASTAIIAAPAATEEIWVYGVFGSPDVTGTIKFEDSAALALSGIMPVLADSPFPMSITPDPTRPWMKCTVGLALHIVTVSCTFDGIIVYALVSPTGL